MTHQVSGAVLCAGFGTRMRPLTEVVPKPLLPFLNTPIVTYSLTMLKSAGIDAIGMNVHHLAETVPPVVDRLAATFGLEIRYSREWEILGTAGGIRGIWTALGEPEGTLVVLNGDSVMDLDLSGHIEEHRESGRDVTLLVRERASDHPGKVFVDSENRLTGLRDYAHPDRSDSDTEVDFLGVHLIEAAALERLELEEGDIIDELYGSMVEQAEGIGVSFAECFWAALDNPDLLMKTTRDVLDSPEQFSLAPLGEPMSEGLYAFDLDSVHDKAEFKAPVFIGMNVEVEAGVRIGPNVVLDGVTVKQGSTVRNAILYGMGEIEGEWSDCVAVAGKIAQISSVEPAESNPESD